ncbi:MAG: acyl-CoA/acyl-ACP dehydrogenase [Deltaproteobacteria bacterium]|jgi:alkylation response protein AidB-like acyl-CoA dehydrogenase|nr:acyl-CoA/acyl-ACP dehydrogenase [Deltaproteobacteria bacterium]
MDITLTKTQKNIAQEARRFLKRECPSEYVQEMFKDSRGMTDELWRKMAGMDWMALRIPEIYGGMGMKQIDMSLLLEEMGRAVVPGPFFSTVILAGETILAAGTDSQKKKYLSDIADGKSMATLALHEPDGGSDPGYIHMTGTRNGDDFILDGTKLYVPDAHLADFIVMPVRTGTAGKPSDNISLFILSAKEKGVAISPLPTMDGTRKLSAVICNGVRLSRASLLGELNKGWRPLFQALQRAQVGLCAESVGGAQKAMEIASDYAKIRVQYDQPIGSFQAVKHMCAQMFTESESSRSMMYWASWAQDYGAENEAAIAASSAKSYCGDAFTQVAAKGIQVLGGTGFTMENEMHLYLKRAKANQAALGNSIYHRERVMQLLLSAKK